MIKQILLLFVQLNSISAVDIGNYHIISKRKRLAEVTDIIEEFYQPKEQY